MKDCQKFTLTLRKCPNIDADRKLIVYSTCNEYVFMLNFKFSSVMVLAVQLFNKSKQNEKKEKTKNMKKHVSLYFTDVMSKYIIFGEFILFLGMF